MKKALCIICVLVCFLFFGCTEGGDTEISDPNDIVGIWTVHKLEKDGEELDFDEGEFQFTATAFTGWITDIESIGDGTLAGDYTADKTEIEMDVTATDNTDLMEFGPQIWSYKGDPSRLKVWYDTAQGFRITIKLEK